MASSHFASVLLAAAGLAAAPLVSAQEAVDRDPSGLSAPASAVRAFLDASGSPQPLCATAEGRAVWETVQAFYAARGDRPAWTHARGLNSAGQRLMAVLGAAGDEGLDPGRYDPLAVASGSPHLLRAAVGAEPVERQAARWDVGLSAALVRYAADLAMGRVDGARGGGLWSLRRPSVDVGAVLLLAAADSGRPDRALATVRPAHPQYASLRAALRDHRRLAAAEAGVPRLPARLKLRPGARSAHVAALRARLALWGDLPPGSPRSDVLDPAVVAALRRFESRHGLAPDGVLDPEAIAALNTPVRERVRQIELNLERWRWQAWPPQGRSVLVNIPTFELHAYDDGVESLSMRVITGKAETATPVFAQEMTSVVFSPYWNVPGNIAQDETLPAVRRDLGYLRRMNLEVLRGDRVVDPRRVDWRREGAAVSFRQRPGASNALGLVKFQLPNPFNVYLHDTPNDSLFQRARRTSSHGCVRLEKPEALARWVLSSRAEWTPARIAAAMRGGREHVVPLEDPIPVAITYFTVWVDGEGRVHFRPDVYRHDAAQLPLLEALEPEPPVAGTLAAVAG